VVSITEMRNVLPGVVVSGEFNVSLVKVQNVARLVGCRTRAGHRGQAGQDEGPHLVSRLGGSEAM